MTQSSRMRVEPDIARPPRPTNTGSMHGWRGLLGSSLVRALALLGLCAAYLQGGLSKLLDWPGAVAEAAHFGLPMPPVTAAATIAVELIGSALVLSGRLRWLGATLAPSLPAFPPLAPRKSASFSFPGSSVWGPPPLPHPVPPPLSPPPSFSPPSLPPRARAFHLGGSPPLVAHWLAPERASRASHRDPGPGS